MRFLGGRRGKMPEEKEGRMILESAQLADSLAANMAIMRRIFRKEDTLIERQVDAREQKKVKVCLYNLDGMINTSVVDQHIIRPITGWPAQAQHGSLLDELERRIIQTDEIKRTDKVKDIVQGVLSGDTAVFLDGYAEALVVNTKGFAQRGIGEPDAEQVRRGPREGLVENLMTNLAMVRRKVKTHDLKFEFQQLGEVSVTQCAICYIQGVADENVLEELRARLSRVQMDDVIDSNYVAESIKDEGFLPLYTVGTTERPDVVAAKLMEGRVALIVDGSPVALTVPYIFAEQLQDSGDYYTSYYFASTMRVLRALALVLTVVTPAIYLALVAFHQEMIPTPLLLSIINARKGVPFPLTLEIIVMLLAFELLKEAGIKAPSGIGQAVSIVGGLVLGQAAVEAKLVSAPVVIVVAFAGITGLTLPKLRATVLVLRMALLLMAAGWGLFGLGLGVCLLLIRLSTVRSFGIPILSNLISVHYGNTKEDILIRYPWSRMKKRGRFISRESDEFLTAEGKRK